MAFHPIRPSEQQVPCPIPLNSFPWVDPMASNGKSSSQTQGDIEPVAISKPALFYMPTQSTEEEWNRIFSVAKDGIALTGSAAAGNIGPVLGKRDIGESDDFYLFRVSLPGVSRDGFTCDVDPAGHILIKGVTSTGEKTVFKHSMKFEMQTQNLCPPGHFSISFNLPGPVNSHDLTGHLGNDGIFEGIVKKMKQPA